MAARRPAPPPPTKRTSWVVTSIRTNPELSGRLAKREPAAAKQEAMYFLREEKSREVKGGARVSEWQAKYSLIRLAFTRTSFGRGYKCQSGLGHRPPSSETCNSRSFGRTRFEYWQQPGNFQRLPQVLAEITKLEASAFGFCLSMNFDECAEARAVNIIDLLQINDNPCGAGCEEIVGHCKQPAALLSEHKTPFERQNVDCIHLALRYFQRHRLAPQGPLRGFENASIIASGFPIPKARQ